MKRFLFVAIILSVFFVFPSQSFADYSSSDGTMHGSLQITPQDPPYAGQNVTLKFQFTDSAKTFQLRECDCQLTIAEPGRLPSSRPLTLQNESGPDVNFVSIPYLFPRDAVYKISLKGQPKKANAYKPFTLSWDVKVQHNKDLVPYTSHKENNSINYLGVIVPVAIIVLFIVFLAFSYLRNRKKAAQ